MLKRKTLLLGILILLALVLAVPACRSLVWFCAYPVQYCVIGEPSYRKARNVADLFMAKTTDGPWEYTRASFVLVFDGSETGAPNWVFRYKNPKTGQNSKGIYVPIPEYKVHITRIGLDSLPMHGSLPK